MQGDSSPSEPYLTYGLKNSCIKNLFTFLTLSLIFPNLLNIKIYKQIPDNSVNIMTRLRIGRPGFDPWQGKIFCLHNLVHIGSGDHLAVA